jgi:hypothetical protein
VRIRYYYDQRDFRSIATFLESQVYISYEAHEYEAVILSAVFSSDLVREGDEKGRM